jgi:site-specific recombinase XerD
MIMQDPPVPARRPRGAARQSLPLADWPAADREAWQRACAPAASLLDDAGGAAHWRPVSREAVQSAYGLWLAALQRQGSLGEADPAARLNQAQVQGFAAQLRQCRTWRTVSVYLGRLGMAAAAMWPRQDWAWLRAMRGVAQRRAMPTRDKAGRLTTPATLLALGESLMAEAATVTGAYFAATRYRDGLMIAMLALLPLRRRNLMGLTLGEQLVQQAGGWIISIPGAETKKHRPIEMSVPAVLAPALQTYLAVHRAYLLSRRKVGSTNRLWLGHTGAPLADLRAWQIITTHTQRRLGVAVNPHLFRDCAASFLGEADPEQVRLAAPLLGHGSFTTTERHYIQAQSRTALRQYHEALAARQVTLRRHRTGSKKGRGAAP